MRPSETRWVTARLGGPKGVLHRVAAGLLAEVHTLGVEGGPGILEVPAFRLGVLVATLLGGTVRRNRRLIEHGIDLVVGVAVLSQLFGTLDGTYSVDGHSYQSSWRRAPPFSSARNLRASADTACGSLTSSRSAAAITVWPNRDVESTPA